ncbi:WH2 domain-containing protein, partial [Trichostrongylus colubriformis]
QVPPPPAPPPPPQNLITAPPPSAATFGGSAKPQAETEEEEKKPDTRSNLLAEIQSGIKLKKVRLAEEAAADKAAAEANDVAAILKRRMEHVMGNEDEESQSSGDDGEWED